MALPSSLWVVGHVDHPYSDGVRLTYQGVEYVLVLQSPGWSVYDPTNLYRYTLSGDDDTGSSLVIGADDSITSGNINYVVKLITYTGGSLDSEVEVGGFNVGDYPTLVVSDYPGNLYPSVLPARVEQISQWLYNILEVPADGEGGYYLVYDFAGHGGYIRISGSEFTLNIDDGGLEEVYSFSWDEASRSGITNCPFVRFVGELKESLVWTSSGTWVPGDDVDWNRPVIAQVWGSGENGTAAGSSGGEAGAGGGYAALDFSIFTKRASYPVVVDVGGGGTRSSVGVLYDYELTYSVNVAASSGGWDGPGSRVSLLTVAYPGYLP